MKTIEQLSKQLEDSLTCLDFRTANDAADELAKEYVGRHLRSHWERPAIQHILMITETFFYRGQTKVARALVAPYAISQEGIEQLKRDDQLDSSAVSAKRLKEFIKATDGLPMRWRLQVVELLYSLRFLESAKKLVDQLFETLPHVGSEFEMGEIYFFRVRIAHREASYDKLLSHAMRAIAALTDIDNPKLEMLVRWRLGQLMLVFGSGAFRYGVSDYGVARLHLSRWFLAPLPDELNKANALHILGSMYRSQRNANHDAGKYLNQARDEFERLKHSLNLARATISLGVYWLNKKADNPNDPTHLTQAGKQFNEAERLAKETGSKRQLAEVYVWQSRLAQQEKNPNIGRAIALGKQAIDLIKEVEKEHYIQVEALLALGNAYLAKDDLKEAEEHFREAQEIASEPRLPKHLFNALLSLAELHLRRSDIQQAWDFYTLATTTVFPNNVIPDNQYLCDKQERVRTSLEQANTFYLTFNEFMRQGKSLTQCQKDLESWLINQAQKHEQGNKAKTAKRLRIPRQRLYNYWEKTTNRRKL